MSVRAAGFAIVFGAILVGSLGAAERPARTADAGGE
jgi:hypothetical protein